jgi:hypothetical protein
LALVAVAGVAYAADTNLGRSNDVFEEDNGCDELDTMAGGRDKGDMCIIGVNENETSVQSQWNRDTVGAAGNQVCEGYYDLGTDQ